MVVCYYNKIVGGRGGGWGWDGRCGDLGDGLRGFKGGEGLASVVGGMGWGFYRFRGVRGSQDDGILDE